MDSAVNIIKLLSDYPLWLQTLVYVTASIVVLTVYLLIVYFPSPDRPILQIKPYIIDTMLRWSDGEFDPHAIAADNSEIPLPFSVALKNVGKTKALDVTVSFDISLSKEDLLAEVKKSNLFPNFVTQGNNIVVATQLGGQQKYSYVPIIGESVRKVDELKEGDDVVVRYPEEIKNAVLLWILSQSYSRTQQMMSNIQNPTPQSINGQANLSSQLLGRLTDGTIALPEITATVKWYDANQKSFSTRYHIKSASGNIGTTWVTNNQTQLLKGGAGLIGFENPNDSSTGFYNLMKNQKAF